MFPNTSYIAQNNLNLILIRSFPGQTANYINSAFKSRQSKFLRMQALKIIT